MHHRRLQTSRWLYHDDQLWVFDATGSVRVEAVPWRVGAIRPHPGHRTVLELIRRARVPCVNPAAVLLRGYDRLSMLNELREAGLPVPTMTIALGEERLDRFEPPLPAVVKVGNYHGGYGKARPRDAEEWANVKDLSFATEEYVTVEPYIAYTRDIRCLAVGGAAVGNGPARPLLESQHGHGTLRDDTGADVLRAYTTRAMEHLGADLLGLDFLETPDGAHILLESNDTPGLAGFPEAARRAVAAVVRRQIEA